MGVTPSNPNHNTSRYQLLYYPTNTQVHQEFLRGPLHCLKMGPGATWSRSTPNLDGPVLDGYEDEHA